MSYRGRTREISAKTEILRVPPLYVGHDFYTKALLKTHRILYSYLGIALLIQKLLLLIFLVNQCSQVIA